MVSILRMTKTAEKKKDLFLDGCMKCKWGLMDMKHMTFVGLSGKEFDFP